MLSRSPSPSESTGEKLQRKELKKAKKQEREKERKLEKKRDKKERKSLRKELVRKRKAKEEEVAPNYERKFCDAANKEEGMTFKTGKWSAAEMELLEVELNDICARQGLGVDEGYQWMLQERERQTKKGKVWHTIAAQFPQRTLKSVYSAAIRWLVPRVRDHGVWDAEDAATLQQMRGQDVSWKHIGEVLNRSTHSLRDKHREIKENQNSIGGAWTVDEKDKLWYIHYIYIQKTHILHIHVHKHVHASAIHP